MRPLYHPPISEITVQSILHALSIRSACGFFVHLAAAECPLNCTTFGHIAGESLPKSSLS